MPTIMVENGIQIVNVGWEVPGEVTGQRARDVISTQATTYPMRHPTGQRASGWVWCRRALLIATLIAYAPNTGWAQFGGGGGGGGGLGGGGGGLGGGGGSFGGSGGYGGGGAGGGVPSGPSGSGNSTTIPTGPDSPSRLPGDTGSPGVPKVADLPSIPVPKGPGQPIPLDPLDLVKIPADPGAAGGGIRSPATPVAGSNDVVINNPPPSVREELDSSEHKEFVRACQPVVKELLRLRGKWGKFGPVNGPLSRSEKENALETLKAYREKCLQGDGIDTLVGSGTKTFLQRRVGVILHSGRGIICTGTRIANRLIITARHCLYVFDESLKAYKFRGLRNLTFKLRPSQSGAIPRAAQIRSIIQTEFYDAKREAYDDTADQYDVVVLELANDVAETTRFGEREFPVEGLKLARNVKLMEKLLLVGYQKNEEFIADLGRQLYPNEAYYRTLSWIDNFAFDYHATCRVIRKVRNVCVAHACQTEFGTSGAPLFRQSSTGELELVAVHTRGFALSDKGTCHHPDTERVPNNGVHPNGRIAGLFE